MTHIILIRRQHSIEIFFSDLLGNTYNNIENNLYLRRPANSEGRRSDDEF